MERRCVTTETTSSKASEGTNCASSSTGADAFARASRRPCSRCSTAHHSSSGFRKSTDRSFRRARCWPSRRPPVRSSWRTSATFLDGEGNDSWKTTTGCPRRWRCARCRRRSSRGPHRMAHSASLPTLPRIVACVPSMGS